MEDVVYYNELYDLYSLLLTDKQRQYFEDYYFQNLSFSEMAENYQVSRNAVFRQIHIVTNKLVEYEDKLQLKNKKERIMKVLENSPKDIKEKIEDIL